MKTPNSLQMSYNLFVTNRELMLNIKNIVEMNNSKISLFGRINWTTYGLKTITVQEAISIIRDGTFRLYDKEHSNSYTLREITELMQYNYKGDDLQTLKEDYLPAVSFNGVYSNGIVEYSSVTALDFDHIPSQEEFTDLYSRLRATPCVGWIYRTPSGKGLKAIVLHDNDNPLLHTNMYQQLMNMFQTPYIKTDQKCKDLSRRNYLCYDPDVWTNPSPIPYHFSYDARYDTNYSTSCVRNKNNSAYIVHRQKPIITIGGPSDLGIMNMLKSRCKRFHPDYLKEGARRDGVYWFGTQMAKAGVDYTLGLEFVNELYNSKEITLTRGGTFTEEEVIENFTNGYDAETYNEQYRKSFNFKNNQP